MSDLFNVPESLSPREKWKRKHGVTTSPPAGEVFLWQARSKTHQATTTGQTEDEALDNLANHLSKCGVPCWATDRECQ